MKARTLGTTGFELGSIGFGGVPLSCTRNRPEEATAIAILHHAIDCGITLIDTADSYCLNDEESGHNERLIGKALARLPASQRDQVVVATKGGWIRPGGSWLPCGRPEHLRRRCEASLANLRTETIDLYQHHTPDSEVPLADSLGELVTLRDEGKIRHLGVSNYTLEQLDEAQAMTQIVSLQNQYSLQHRQPEKDGTLAATRARGLAFLPWSPLGGLTRARSLAAEQPVLREIALQHGVSVHRVALAWLLAKGPHVLPIPGASRASTIEDSALASDLELTSEEMDRLDRSEGPER